MSESEASQQFSSTMPIIVYTRPADSNGDWQELDRGPGYFTIPDGSVARVRIKSISDYELTTLVDELQGFAALRFLDLAENRNVTNAGLARLRALPQLTGLSLSSCSITNAGLEHLRALPNLVWLDLSYCNRLNDAALKPLEAMRTLTFVNLQGCLGIGRAGLARMRRRTLEIQR